MKLSTSIKIFGLTLAAVIAFLPALASAHTLETESTVGALLHIDPNDEPVAGEPATIYIELQDKSGKLTPGNCNCHLVILFGEKQIFANPVFQSGAVSLSTQASFVFPEPGAYTVSIDGEPKTEIEPFDLDFPVQVKAPATLNPKAEKIDHTLHYIVFGAGGIALLAYWWYDTKRRKKSRH
jgi:hypothetical protein